MGFLAVTVAFAAACTSPTLPLPPPSLPSVTAGSTAGHVKLTSIRGAEPNAVLVFYNHNPSLSPDERVDGTLADGEGSWSAEIRADSGDQIDVTQESENGKSPPTTVKIP
ncbi:MAG: hypothetical protein U0169_14520 [Polyangiaceae bacterium]